MVFLKLNGSFRRHDLYDFPLVVLHILSVNLFPLVVHVRG